MPYTLDWESGIVTKTFSGFMSAVEFVGSAEEIIGHPTFDALQFVINDCTSVEGHHVDADAIDAVAALRLGAETMNPNIRVVVVSTVASVMALFLAAGHPLRLGGSETHSFASMLLARAWIQDQPTLYGFRRLT